MLLLAVWWVWSSTAWVTDRFDPQRPAIQLLVIATMVGSLVMAVAVPEAFGEQGLVFAGAYVAIQVGRSLFLVLALRGHELQRDAVRVLFWFGVSAVPWIAGALVHGTARGGAVDAGGGRGLHGVRTRLPDAGAGPRARDRSRRSRPSTWPSATGSSSSSRSAS